MAIAPTIIKRLASGTSGHNTVVGTVAGPASYATGGLLVDIPTDLGITAATNVSVQSNGAYIATFDGVNSKIKFNKVNTTSGLLEEAASTTDVSGETVTVVAWEQI